MADASTGMTPATIAMFVGTGVLQVIGVSILPMTQGMTALWPTVAFALIYTVAFWLMAQLLVSGINLSALIPILAAAIPLLAIAVSVLIYKEPASLPKIGMLTTACLMIGYASTLK